MPSSKYIDKSETFKPLTIPLPIVKQTQDKNVVSYDQWFEQNYDHLTYIYRFLQDSCTSTGRHIFDSHTCNFTSFCRIAYTNSYKYQKHDPDYDPDYESETELYYDCEEYYHDFNAELS